tara:strand:+ start:888 stop:1718 length:831 start_codon:yes stop_codon:yes gene_type:complete
MVNAQDAAAPASEAVAANTESVAEAGILTKSLMAFEQGGTWMWVILGLQLISFAIIIERVISLYLKRKDGAQELADQFEEPIRRGQIEEAHATAQKNIEVHPVYASIAAGTKAAMEMGGKEEIQLQMDQSILKESQFLDQRTGFLSMLANVGTLTGLLGTIVGMIKSFTAVASASAAEKAELLSSGIAEAMNTTAYGLIMAIPALIAFSVFTNRSNQLVENLTQGSLKVFHWLTYCYEPTVVADERTPSKNTIDRAFNDPKARISSDIETDNRPSI